MFGRSKYSDYNIIKYLMIFIFLIFGIILPSFVSIKIEMEKQITSKQYQLDLTEPITKGKEIQEKIYLPKYIQKYGIMFATYNRKNIGLIKIQILQKDNVIEEIVDVSKLKDNAYYYLKMKFSKLKEGEALLKITGINGKEGQSVSLHRSSDIIYGELIQNNSKTNKSLLHDIKFYEINNTVKGQYFFLLLSIILFSLGIRITFKSNKSKSYKYLYLVTIFLIYSLVSIKAPVLTFKAEPYAEQIFNFLYNGKKYGFFQNLFIMDAGYLPLFQRLIGLVIIKFVHNTKFSVILMSNVAVLYVAMIVSVFTLENYKKYGSRIYRFLISLVLGVFNLVPYGESHSFINFGYMNIILLFYISLLDLKKLKKKNFIAIMVLTFLLCLSKSHTIVLLPICVIILIIFWKFLIKREKIFLSVINFASLIQIIYMHKNINVWKSEEGLNKIVPLDIIDIGTHQVVQQFINLFSTAIEKNQNILNYNLMFLILLTIFIFFLFYLFKKSKSKENVILIILMSIIFGTSYINVISNIWNGTDLWNTTLESINSRHSILIKISYILIFVLLPFCIKKLDLINLKKKKKYFQNDKYKIISLIVLLFLTIRYSPKTNNDIYRYDKIFSDWRIYSKFYDSSSFVIPVEPYIMHENQKMYYVGKNTLSPEVVILQGEKYYFENLNSVDGIAEINLPKPIKIEYLYVKRVRNYNFDKLRLIGYDSNNNIIVDSLQLNKSSKGNIGFKINNPKEISKISFITDKNKYGYVVPEIIIGESLN